MYEVRWRMSGAFGGVLRPAQDERKAGAGAGVRGEVARSDPTPSHVTPAILIARVKSERCRFQKRITRAPATSAWRTNNGARDRR